jgi:glycosyltransferase involved in cell wall biosynthesis
MRLAIFIDQVFWHDGKVFSTDGTYELFAASLRSVGEIIFIGRLAPRSGRAHHLLDHVGVTILPLPYYRNLYQLWRANPKIYWQVRRTISEHAPSWDALLVAGPNPIGQMIARQCIALGVPLALIVRQNLVEQMRAHRGLKRLAAMSAAHVLERDFRRLARGRTVFTVGMEMAREYARFSNRVYNHFGCVVDNAQFKIFSAMPHAGDPSYLLSVGRLAPEKGHKYLLEALAILKARGLKCHLEIVGSGPLEQELMSQVSDRGLTGEVTFNGYVPLGPALFELYQRSGALVLSSLTEGFPQVINEALTIGLPTVATTVGGIPAFLTNEKTGLLVPPADAMALANAIHRVVLDPILRKCLSENGRALMANNTLECSRDRILEILHREVFDPPVRQHNVGAP